jgi:7-cyano-7-deazaguanine reductase
MIDKVSVVALNIGLAHFHLLDIMARELPTTGPIMTDEKKLTGLTLLKKGEMRYPTSPDEADLETFENANQQRNYWITFETSEFTSLCPITGQPDFATIKIEYIPGELCVESKSLKLYLFSFRQTGTFYEEIVNRIYTDLSELLKPKRLVVNGDFTARGGITSSVKIDSAEA